MNTVFTQSGATDFRMALRDELVRRCKANPRYSLRAFARALGIGPSYLSMLLNGKRRLSSEKTRELGLRIGLTPIELEKFSVANDKNDEFHPLALDQFELISDWCHFAILELVSVKRFQGNPKWIAQALGISVNEVNAAVERLVRLGMLKVCKDGKWKNISGSNTNHANGAFVSVARRKLQAQVLQKALAALEEVPFEMRDQSSITMAIDVSRIPEAKKMLQDFRRKLSRFLQNGNQKDDVYNLSLSLYPVTRVSEKHERSLQ